MRLVIIGWYGTETIGDRAILAGLIKMLNDVIDPCEVSIGSIYPFFTERTVHEDASFWNEIVQREIAPVTIFDSRNRHSLCSAIESADAVAIGGGPFMDISWMIMLEYALIKAKKLGKKTAILGCGIGPLHKKQYICCATNIIALADVCVFRDTASLEYALKLVPSKENMIAAIDPAAILAHLFRQHIEVKKETYAVANLRLFPIEYVHSDTSKIALEKIFARQLEIIKEFSVNMDIVKLVPMHYFGIGGDDRIFLNHAVQHLGKGYEVQNKPLSLKQTLLCFAAAQRSLGMRFHSVVLQTICNGNNYVLDYTEKDIGKISGFLSQLNATGHYANRYINLQSEQKRDFVIEDRNFIYDQNEMDQFQNLYHQAIERVVRI